MNQIKVEKGIPLPTARSAYPWGDMEVGDSFFVSGNDGSRLRSAKVEAEKRLPAKYTTRKVDDGFRVWRVE